jgi:hypothetical protein
MRERELAQIEAKDRGGRGKNAKAHEDAETAALARVPAARAKAEALGRMNAAQARLDEAQAATKAGPAEVSMLATIIGGQLGRAPADVARSIALVTTLASIAVTLVMALLAEQATLLIMKGLALQGVGREQEAQQAGEVLRAPALPVETEKPTRVAPRGRKPLTPEERIERFIAEHVKLGQLGGEIRVSEFYNEFMTWWKCHVPMQPVPKQRTLSLAMSKRGLASVKRGGVMRYEGISLAPLGVN